MIATGSGGISFVFEGRICWRCWGWQRIRRLVWRFFGTMGLLAGFACIYASAAAAHEEVSFEMIPPGGNPLKLTAVLREPRQHGPFATNAAKDVDQKFAAVVLLHGCDGFTGNTNVWAAKLERWGYVVLQVDSFEPRGQKNNCELGPDAAMDTRVLDANAAKSYLAGLPYVDAKRIAVLGWSHGGTASLNAIASNGNSIPHNGDPFRAAVAFYPWCPVPAVDLKSPLLILIGEKDDRTPVKRCRTMLSDSGTLHTISLKEYSSVYHAFDVRKSGDLGQQGYHLEYNPEATADAATQVKNFLHRHLQQE